MSNDLSKLSANYLRFTHSLQSQEKLKASHARELVAALFGYKSHASLMAEKYYPLHRLAEARILVPDIPLIEARRAKLAGLPNDLLPSHDLARSLSTFLKDEGYCAAADVWIYDTLETYVHDVLLLHHQQARIDDELSGVMAETNASFDWLHFDDVTAEDHGDGLAVIASGQYQGEPLDDKPFCGDTLDITVTVTLPRIAGMRGFTGFELEAVGSVNDDWIDP